MATRSFRSTALVATVGAVGLVLLLHGCGDSRSTSPQVGPAATGDVVSDLVGSQVGLWSAVFDAPIVQLHVHLMTDGRVLSWGRNGDPQIWDPATGAFTPAPSPAWLFCAGHDFLPDGRLLVAGGHIDDGKGLPNSTLFDPVSGTWQSGPPMTQGRWYPTNTVLPDGEMLTIAGTDENGVNVTIPEVWNGTSWRQLTGASKAFPYYPRMFVAPDGRLYYAGEDTYTWFLDVTGNGSWTGGPTRVYTVRDYGSAVMYAPGKILYAGGGDPPTETAEIIDLNDPAPQWRFTGSMMFARRQVNATVLPTGEVLVTGGTSGSGFNNPVGATLAAELWNPETGSWTTLAPNSVVRIYHSTALLLPDGRVLSTGSGDGGDGTNELNYELFSPPYLFKGLRPIVTTAPPPTVSYGQRVFVGTPDAAILAKVTLVRFGSVTHAFSMGQRLVPASFTPALGGVSIDIPASRAVAPPGPYMLFLLNAAGVPSVGRIIRLQ